MPQAKEILRIFKKRGLLYRLYIKRASVKQSFYLFKAAVKMLRGQRKYPFSVLLSITYKCQCDCVHCGIIKYKNETEQELNFEQIKKIIFDLKRLGVLNVTLTGGEPLLRKDVFDIIRYISGQGLIVTLDTNGLLLDMPVIKKLKLSGLNLLKVSIDSSEADVHDRLRDMTDCFNKAVRGLKNSVKLKLPCVIQTYVSYHTVERDELRKIITLARELDLRGVCVQSAKASGKLGHYNFSNQGIHNYIKKNLDTDYVYFSNITADFSEYARLSKRECYISSYGELRPGMFVPEKFGNVVDSDFKSAWNKMIESPIYDRTY
jgi:MoaA/NifB/PqqE/SkfB family radical SAM enzyme